MADSELARHQAIWSSFSGFVKYGTISVAVLMLMLRIFLIGH
jgi:hypothetical protein